MGRHKAAFPTPEEATQAWGVLCDESDRGFVLCALSLLDNGIELILRRAFASVDLPRDQTDRLLTSGTMPPLGNFSVRVQVCRAFGLIDQPLHEALAEFNSCRTEAAHLWKEFKLAEQKFTKMEATLTAQDKRFMAVYKKAVVEHKVGPLLGERVPQAWLIVSLWTRLLWLSKHPKQYRKIMDTKGMGDSILERLKAKANQPQSPPDQRSGSSSSTALEA